MVHLTTECLPQNYRFYRFSRAPSFNVLYLRLAARFSIVAPSLRCIAYGLAERFILHYYFFPRSPRILSRVAVNRTHGPAQVAVHRRS